MTSGKLVALGLIGVALLVFAGLMWRNYQTVPGETIVYLDTGLGRYATKACIENGQIDANFAHPDAAAGVDQITGRTVRTTYAAIRGQAEEDENIRPDDICRNAGGFLEERSLFAWFQAD